jgi:hypothetical protein
MKRCPQCLFIYPESDTRCDFDNTPLVVVDETELEAVTGQQTPTPPTPTPPSTPPRSSNKGKRKPRSSSKRPRKFLLVAAAVGVIFGVIAFLAYYKLTQRTSNLPETQSVASVPVVPTAAPQSPVVAPSPVDTPSPSPSPSATPKSTPERVATAHSSTTVAPVSTSGPGIGKKLGGKPVILLTSGAKIDADEVWRTRDGVWYRRNGLVTLLKHSRVKSIQ